MRFRFRQPQEFDPASDISDSVSRGEPVRDWWERAHRKNQRVWISGTPPIEIFTRLTVLPMLKLGVRVLNIGVGTGDCTRTLAGGGLNVSVLDISSKALAKVSDVADGWLASELDRIPASTFDLALSHLVAQHMRNDELLHQLRAVIRALKPEGVFAIQYVDTLDGVDTENETDSGLRGGGVRRSPSLFARLVTTAGGKVVWDQPREKWVATMRVAHVARL